MNEPMTIDYDDLLVISEYAGEDGSPSPLYKMAKSIGQGDFPTGYARAKALFMAKSKLVVNQALKKAQK